MQQFDITPELEHLPLKSYWKAHIQNKQLVLDRQIREQGW